MAVESTLLHCTFHLERKWTVSGPDDRKTERACCVWAAWKDALNHIDSRIEVRSALQLDCGVKGGGLAQLSTYTASIWGETDLHGPPDPKNRENDLTAIARYFLWLPKEKERVLLAYYRLREHWDPTGGRGTPLNNFLELGMRSQRIQQEVFLLCKPSLGLKHLLTRYSSYREALIYGEKRGSTWRGYEDY
ncbi:hypothetical protein NQZ68_011898 [Dissostichus eleginoides]|nr:hypothetical protein NQZ68_011898 [Dissostichus eleginoides]